MNCTQVNLFLRELVINLILSMLFMLEIKHSSMAIKPLPVATTGKSPNLKHTCPGTAEKSKSAWNLDALNIFNYKSVSLTKQKAPSNGCDEARIIARINSSFHAQLILESLGFLG